MSLRVDQVEAKPRSYFSAFLNSQESQRGKGEEVRGQCSRSAILLLRLSHVGRGIMCDIEQRVLCMNFLGGEIPLPFICVSFSVTNDTKGAICFCLKLCQDLLHKLPKRMPHANTRKNSSLDICGDSLVILKGKGRRSRSLCS